MVQESPSGLHARSPSAWKSVDHSKSMLVKGALEKLETGAFIEALKLFLVEPGPKNSMVLAKYTRVCLLK